MRGLRAIPVQMLALALMVGSFITSACQADPEVTILTSNGGDVSFQVEVADTPAKRELGLMYRRDLPSDRGMIFLFPMETEQAFWMKNTPIPLDMIFISSSRRIVGIVQRAAPFTLDARSVPGSSQYVLEINGGLSDRYGFKPGDRVQFKNIPADVRE
ncbi:MAG TPA: DUF192 domain-containing protein [Candidatus Binatia bacterium]